MTDIVEVVITEKKNLIKLKGNMIRTFFVTPKYRQKIKQYKEENKKDLNLQKDKKTTITVNSEDYKKENEQLKEKFERLKKKMNFL